MSTARRKPDPDPLNLPAHRDSELGLCIIAERFPRFRARLEHDTSPDDFAFPLPRKLRGLVLQVGAGGVKLPHRAIREAWPAGEDPPEALEAMFNEMDDSVAMPEHWEWHHKRLKDAAQRRRVAKESEALMLAACDGHTTADIVEAGTRLFREVLSADPEARRRCRPTGTLLADLSEAASAPQMRKIRTGLWTVDNMTGGIALGEVLTLVGRTRVGKSALGIQVLLNSALKGIPCGLFSLEMPAEQAMERALQCAWGLTDKQVQEHARTGYKNLTPDQSTALQAIEKNLAIIDGGKSNVAELDVELLEATGRLGRTPLLGVVDHLGLLASGAKNLPVYQRVSEAALDVKSWAKRHRLAVVLLCQTGRSQDKAVSEGAAYIGLDAARDSGQVEEFADFLLTLWRPELRSTLSAAERAAVAGQLKGHLCKNRRGDEPLVHFHFDRPTQRITDPIPGDES
jgi:replicative DNA helicase